MVVALEHPRSAKGWRVTREQGGAQIGAAHKGLIPDADDAAGYGHVGQARAALELIRNLSWAEVLSVEDTTLEIRIRSGYASELNRLLVTNRIEVSSFYPRRTLEDFFLKVTEGTSEI